MCVEASDIPSANRSVESLLSQVRRRKSKNKPRNVGRCAARIENRESRIDTSCFQASRKRSEGDGGGELDLARAGAGGHAGDQTGAGAAVDAGITRISGGDMVKGVEGVHAELAFDALLDGHVLQQREVVVEERWTGEGIARG